MGATPIKAQLAVEVVKPIGDRGRTHRGSTFGRDDVGLWIEAALLGLQAGQGGLELAIERDKARLLFPFDYATVKRGASG